jgi:phenylacetate-CoA ligase
VTTSVSVPEAPRDDLAAALDATIDRARQSPLYRERLAGLRVRALEDLARVPLTTRADLQRAGIHGLRAVPLERVCHYGETSGTTGAANAVWLTAGDLARSARAIRSAHPDVFAPGRVILNRFPFMAAPAHLMQLIAQEGGGVAVPAGNINWDVPFPRALELAERTGAQVLAGLPLEPVVLGEIARARGLDPARDLAVDTLFLGGAPLPPVFQRRLARAWGARVIELYGSTETMLLGTSCAGGSLHLETALAHCELLDARGEPVPAGGEGRLVVTTLGLEGSPLVRLDTGDVLRRGPEPCACGSPRPVVTVLGRASETVDLAGRRLHTFDLIDAAAAAADALDSHVFFVVVLADRVLVRVETRAGDADPVAAFRARLPGVALEVERTPPGMLLDVDAISRSPRVYKPVVLSDWRGGGRPILTVLEGMMEWPRPSGREIRRWLGRLVATAVRRARLRREQKSLARRAAH